VSGGTIERSVAHDNGSLCDSKGGPVGIWTYDSERITIQYNESYLTHTALADGGGFDLDQNTRNTIVQYNYSHNNDGAGFLMAHSPNNSNHYGNIIRYNISENDSRKRSSGGIVIWARTQGDEIYQNTVYMSPVSGQTPRAVFIHNSSISSNYAKNVHLRNNTFYTTSGVPVVYVMSGMLSGSVDLRFEGNNYYGGSVAPKIMWGSTTYTALTNWRTATGQEKVAGLSVGLQANPGLTSPGAGGTIGNADKLSTLTAYKLVTGSAQINKGLDLLSKFGLVVPTKDFYALSTPYGVMPDVGAHEFH
jgi:hypothetical protein